MIRNKYYFSVAGPPGPQGAPGTSITTPNPTTINGIVTWADATGTSLGDPSLLVYANNENIGLGNNFPNVTTGQKNVSCGTLSMQNITTAENNVCAGFASLGQLVSGTGNTALGLQAGLNYTGNESYNILISNYGTVGDTGVIRIGYADHSQCYIAGIYDNMSPTGDKRPVYIDSNGKLTTTFSTNVIPMGEIYYENPVTDTRTLSVGVAAQISVPGGLFYNTQFSSPSNSQLQFTGSYTRYATISATISCVIAAGTNQLLNFEFRKNGSKIPGTGTRVNFSDTTDYHTITLQKMISITTNDIITVYVTNTSGSNDLQVYSFNLSAIISAN
jgi:hypothetical protein